MFGPGGVGALMHFVNPELEVVAVSCEKRDEESVRLLAPVKMDRLRAISGRVDESALLSKFIPNLLAVLDPPNHRSKLHSSDSDNSPLSFLLRPKEASCTDARA